MIYKIQKNLSLTLFMFLHLTLYSAQFEKHQLDIKMGPILHFNGTEKKDLTWHVSALYLLKSSEPHPELVFDKNYSSPKILGTKFGYDFVRYDMTIHQTKQRKTVEYMLGGEKLAHRFFVPAIGQSTNILYHSCNGFQHEKDREKMGGINAMWADINLRHLEEPYELQLGGGDQIYADGLINDDSCEPSVGSTHGVFALPTLQEWLLHKEQLGFSNFSNNMMEEVEKFYFDHYVRHYNTAEFRETMASIPSLVQADDHDYYDGCGSYPPYLQDSPVMSGVRNIASWYVNTIQHQKRAEDKMAVNHFLHVINDGKLAILGIDTRTERTENQVASPNSWDAIFNCIEKLDASCEHLIVMLAIPVVSFPVNVLDKIIDVAESSSNINNIIGIKRGIKNDFGLFELADDARDNWAHLAHRQERNDMIAGFQNFAHKTHTRVSFLSGDIHLAGAGKIFQKGHGAQKDDSDIAIWQIISSPVGNAPTKSQSAKILGRMARQKRDVGNGCDMRIFKLRREYNKNGHSFIARRNYVTLKLMPNMDLNVKWSAESKKAHKPHKLYYITIPPIKNDF